jgi:iron(III) transport system permease protein
MISCLILERPGVWRTVGVATLLLSVVLPAVPLLWTVFVPPASTSVFAESAFGSALGNSIVLALGVAAVSLGIGLPLGVLTVLYEFPGRGVFLALVTLPLLIPSFLLAIGWASVAARLGASVSQALSGLPGCLLVMSTQGIPLVLLIAYAATSGLSGSQVDAARLAGGERVVFCSVARYVAIPAFLAAGLGGVLTLSDPGPGQIFGLSTAASEILTSFSARYDFARAGRQCVMLTALVLALAAPLVLFAMPRLASEVLVRQSREVRRIHHQWVAGVTVVALGVFVLIGITSPLVGLTLPLAGGTTFFRAWNELARTAGNTLCYAVGAGTVATVLGLLLAVCVGRNAWLKAVCIGAALGLLSLPPAFTALGIVQLAAAAPAWTDPFLRSRFTVCVALGLRFLPVAAVLSLRAWGATSPTWAFAAGVHGVPLGTYLRRVLLPILLPVGGVVMLLVGLLATADITTMLLLHPPGETSLPVAVFTVMANAPETLVASLCLVYVTTAMGVLTVAWTVARGRNV